MSTAWSNIQETDLLHIRQICSVKERKKERRRRKGGKGRATVIAECWKQENAAEPSRRPVSERGAEAGEVSSATRVPWKMKVVSLARRLYAANRVSRAFVTISVSVRREPRAPISSRPRLQRQATGSQLLVQDWSIGVVSARLIDTSPSEADR